MVPHARQRRPGALGALGTVAVLLVVACAPAGAAPTDEPTATTGGATEAMPTPGSTVQPTTGGASTRPTAGDGAIRIPLSGTAPDAIALDRDTAWILAGEGGTLMAVDLAGGREVRSIEVGFGATHLVLLDERTAAVARFDDSGNGFFLVLVDLATGSIRGIPTRALGGLARGGSDTLWALERAGRLLEVDPARNEVIGSVDVEIDQNVHTEVQWGAGSAWVGSDGTPVLRIAEEDLAIEAEIDVPSGLPFRFDGELLWGAGPTNLWAIDPATNAIVHDVTLVGVIEILAIDIDGDDAWLAVRRPGHVGRVLHLALPGGAVVAELDVSLPAAIRLAPDQAWVASYLGDELVGFPR